MQCLDITENRSWLFLIIDEPGIIEPVGRLYTYPGRFFLFQEAILIMIYACKTWATASLNSPHRQGEK